jgi:hypothetical protein
MSLPIIELGIGKANAEDITTKLTYKSTAPYGRIGMDWNLRTGAVWRVQRTVLLWKWNLPFPEPCDFSKITGGT